MRPARNCPPPRSATWPRCARLAVDESVILRGPVGVGKTHVAQALGHLVIRQGAEVRFIKTSRLLATLASGHADRTWDKRLHEFVRPAVLILDDFGMREDLRTQRRRRLDDPHFQPISNRLVPAVSQPRGRRVTAGQAHQHQSPGVHKRTQHRPHKRPGTKDQPRKENIG